MIKCPNPDCGFENVDGTQFCEGCGEELTQGAASAAPAAASGDMIKCPACDNLNPAENVICEVCGSDLKPNAAPVGTAPATAAAPTAGTMAPQNASGAGANASPYDLDDTAAATPGPAANAPAVSAPAPAAGGTTAPPVSQMPTATVTVPGGDSPAAAPGGDTPVAAPANVAGDSGIGPVVSAAPATTPFDTSSQQNTGIAPALGDGGAVAAAASAPPDTASVTAGAPTSAAMATPAATTGGTLAPGAVKLTVEQGMSVGKQFVLGDPVLLVGREDTDEDIYPDIDLSDQDEGFVHRRHAELKFENGGLTVTHLGGANKTRVNNRPLPDNEATPVNIGDKIAFGKVVLRVGAN